MCYNFSVTLTVHPSINASAYAVYCLVLLKVVLLGLLSIFVMTLSNTIFNNNLDSVSLVSSLFLCTHASVSYPWIFTSPLESCNIILITFCSMTTQWLLSASARACTHAHNSRLIFLRIRAWLIYLHTVVQYWSNARAWNILGLSGSVKLMWHDQSLPCYDIRQC